MEDVKAQEYLCLKFEEACMLEELGWRRVEQIDFDNFHRVFKEYEIEKSKFQKNVLSFLTENMKKSRLYKSAGYER